ncbi:MAG TPA: MFS transporter, partial [Salinisphaeraceae bacterium]|nr:MFS transporter [Salinisphaeraceae bacterium]
MLASQHKSATAAARSARTRFRNASIALFAAGFATYTTLYAVQPLMPLFSADFGVSPAASSLSLSLTTAVLAFSILITGLMSEALERKKVMGTCMAAAAILSLLAAVAPNW